MSLGHFSTQVDARLSGQRMAAVVLLNFMPSTSNKMSPHKNLRRKTVSSPLQMCLLQLALKVCPQHGGVCGIRLDFHGGSKGAHLCS